MSKDKSNIWSGFWARLLAFIVDLIVLGAICYAFGMMASDYAASLGSNGRAFGLVLGVIYFGLTASGLFGGRSIGMRALGLKVVRLDGRPLGLIAAFGRALLLVAPMMLNGWYFTVADSNLAYGLTVVAVTAVVGVGLAQIYLLLFNGPTRRLVHDLVFGSIVVRAGAGDFEAPKVGAHAVVAAVLVMAGLGLGIGGQLMMQAWLPKLAATMGPLQRVMDAENKLPEVVETTVGDNTTTYYSNAGPAQTTRTLVVTAKVRKWPADVNQELARIGAVAVKSYRFAPGQGLTVRIVYGFDLGFASYSNSYTDQFSTQCTRADVKCLAR